VNSCQMFSWKATERRDKTEFWQRLP
jgi:hypothetical protein